jgi:phosphoribosylformimino-5-aminoimidazole carboxamide ribotide isomerase
MNSFTIYPAIDLLGGKCVRLFQGDYGQETVYSDSPVQVAEQFYNDGASWIHLVDLDGARQGHPVNAAIIREVKHALSVKVQVGGGIRSEKDVSAYLDAGIDRVILGSAAISHPGFVKEMLEKYGRRIAIGLDAREGYVAVEGWTKTSEMKAETLANELIDHGAETFIFTDISKDGTLTGPNIKAISDLARLTGKEVIASGGVSSLEDVEMLYYRAQAGVSGAIIGKALYTEALSLKDALDLVES